MLAHDSKPSMLLQQPRQMGSLRLKNRVVMGPMGTTFGPTDGRQGPEPNQQFNCRSTALNYGGSAGVASSAKGRGSEAKGV